MDGKFVPLHDDLTKMGIDLNVTVANEHVPLIKWQIRVIKEHIHATRHSLPFKYIPLLMLLKMVYTWTKWINTFPPKDGISDILSSQAIVTSTQLNYKTDCQLLFGTYIQAH